MDDDLIAYELMPRTAGDHGFWIEPASPKRDWMERQGRFAYRCLPLSIANQNGWLIRIKHGFIARWSGEDGVGGVTTESETWGIGSHFGQGVLTFNIPWLFRTPPGWNLVTRGVPNWAKHGISALEGVVETDWAPMSFTMNWKFTAPGVVVFEDGDAIAFIYPQRRGDVERWHPRFEEHMPSVLHHQYGGWARAREAHNRRYGGSEWMKHYHHGTAPAGGRPIAGHQTKLRVRPFEGLTYSETPCKIKGWQTTMS